MFKSTRGFFVFKFRAQTLKLLIFSPYLLKLLDTSQGNFKITPTEDMPPLGALLQGTKTNEKIEMETSPIANYMHENYHDKMINEGQYEMEGKKTLRWHWPRIGGEDRSASIGPIEVGMGAMGDGETVRVLLEVFVKGDANVQGNGNAWGLYEGRLVIGGRARNFDYTLQNEERSEYIRVDAYEDYARKGEIVAIEGAVTCGMACPRNQSKVEPVGTEREMITASLSFQALCRATIYYEGLREQQRFIIARDGFCVFHSAKKFLYFNSSTGQFYQKGLEKSPN